MRRVVAFVIVGICLAGVTLRAQSSTHAIRINGYGGFGFGLTSIASGNLFHADYRDLSSELGLEASGFVYDARLLNYSLATFWDGNNTAIDQGSARANGLSFNGGLSFFSLRSFPFTFYFTRSHSNASGSLIPAFSTQTALWGLRGELKQPQFALISYNVGVGKTENDLPNGDVFNTRNRFANVSATRKLRGWDLRLGDDYLKTVSTFSNFLDRTNTLGLDASRAFGERLRLNLGATYSAFAFQDLTGANSSHSGVTLLNGSLTWKHTERLDSFYNFHVARNAVNTLRVLTTANGTPGATLPFNAQALDSTSETFSAGANYRHTSNLTLNANLSYSHNGIPQPTLASLALQTQAVMATDVLNAGGGYSYHRKIWKLDYHNASSSDWQHFSLLNGRSESGLGLSLDNGMTGGDVRKLRFSGSFRYSQRSNPVFFNVVTTSDRRATLKLDSNYLRFVSFQGLADFGITRLNLAGSNIHLDTSNYMLSANLPRRRLSIFASRGVSSSAERFFGPGSIIFQPDGSTGGVPLPAPLLNPLIYSDVLSKRLGLVWRPRPNLEVESRLSRNQYLFTFLNEMANRYRQFGTMVLYKFGRFTITLGYSRANGEAPHFNQQVNRFFLRVRFPFHVL